MPTARANSIDVDYAQFGPADAPALVLVRGLGTQRIMWPEKLLAGLVDRGLRVITPDNRDVGHSTKLDAAGTPDVAAVLRAMADGAASPSPYSVADMASDVVGLLDALEVERAHVMGISMGGMIVQHLAASHGERLVSMTSVMSSSGAPGLPAATPEAMAALMSAPSDPNSRDSVIENSVASQKVFGSPGYPTSDEDLRAAAGRAYDRCHHPAGVARQMAAVMADNGRFELLEQVRVPTLVLHGEADPLIPIECGRDTAQRIAGARFHSFEGMGHDLPSGLLPQLVEVIADHTQRAG
jgi:pimeloyl-ACP methyl ester carboxylesterase